MYEVVDTHSGVQGARYTAIPRFILMEGTGATNKGLKAEWMTVKDEAMFVGQSDPSVRHLFSNK